MLAKVIPKTSSQRVSARNVLAYLGRDNKDQATELAEFGAPLMGAVNFDVGLASPEDRIEAAEIWDALSRTSARAAKARDPLFHVSLSWPSQEHPSPDQVSQACLHILKTLGFENCMAIWALHRDTHNEHVHLVINKVEPEPPHRYVEKPFRDFLVLDKAMRELEILQGWSHDNGPYIALMSENGEKEIVRMSRAQRLEKGLLERPERFSQPALRAEKNMGEASFQRWVKEAPAQVIKGALALPGADWNSVHAALGELGVRLEAKGSGLVLTTTLSDGRVLAAKASQVGRFAGKGPLEEKLGPFEPALSTVPAIQSSRYEADIRRLAGPAARRSPDQDALREARAAERAAQRDTLTQRFETEMARAAQERQAIKDTLRATHAHERKALADVSARERAHIRQTVPKADRALARSIQAFEAARAREAMQKAQTAQRRDAYAPFHRELVWRRWLEQLAGAEDAAAQAALRGILYREQRRRSKEQDGIEGQKDREAQDFKPHVFDGLTAAVDKKGRRIQYVKEGRVVFTDAGARVDMHSKASDDLEAALRLAAQKFAGQVTLTGSAQFRERAARQAARLGIRVLDDDLQQYVVEEQKAVKADFKPRPTRVPKTSTRRDEPGMGG